MSVTLPPVIITDTTPLVARLSGNPGFTGPYVVGSSLYAVLSEANFDTLATPKLGVYKSVDGGASWASQDSANRPTLYKYGSLTLGISACLPALVGATIPILYGDFATTGQLKIITFDTATDTFGTPTVANGTAPTFPKISLARDSGGDLWAFFSAITSGSTEGIYYQKNSAGTWSAKVSLTSAGASEHDYTDCVYVDSGNLIHVVYAHSNNGFSAHALHHKTFTTAGVQGADQTLATSVSGFDNFRSAVRVVEWNSTLRFVDIQYPERAARAWSGTPATAASPTWTNEVLGPGQVIISAPDTEGMILAGGDGLLYAFWIELGYPVDPADIVDRIYYKSNSGSGWTPATVYYDEVANPQQQDPSIDPFDQFLHTISLTQLANGTFSVITALEEGGACAGYYLLDQVPGTPPTLICNSPPGGFVGVAYSHQLGLSGGTPPYTVTITVGALPDGLAIDDAGLIAGTPTLAGTFQFTVHVVDATTAIANVTCAIVIVDLPASNCPDADQGGPG